LIEGIERARTVDDQLADADRRSERHMEPANDTYKQCQGCIVVHPPLGPGCRSR
jgi:hypothetical protein